MAITSSPFHMGMNFRIKLSLLQKKRAHPPADERHLYQWLLLRRAAAAVVLAPVPSSGAVASSNHWEVGGKGWSRQHRNSIYSLQSSACVCERERASERGRERVLCVCLLFFFLIMISLLRSHMRRRVKTYSTLRKKEKRVYLVDIDLQRD